MAAAAETSPLARRSVGDEARIFIAALLFRVFSAGVGFLANVVFPQYQDQRFSVFRDAHLFWDAFARYDAGWYHGIAAQGYEYGAGGRSNLAFFPVYPLLMRGGGWLLGGRQQDYYFAGIVISWLAFAAAMTLLYRLALLDLTRSAALRAVIYAAAFPFAYFFGMVYSESVFFLALVGAAYALRTRRWLAGAVAGALVTATRVTGLMAVPGLALAGLAGGGARSRDPGAGGGGGGRRAGRDWRLQPLQLPHQRHAVGLVSRDHVLGLPPGGNPFSGLGALASVLATDPYRFLATGRLAPYDTLNAAAAVGALALVPFIWRRFNAGYAVVVVAALALPLSSGQFEGLGRYTSVLFPLPLLLASFGGELRHHILIGASAILYALGLAMFVTVHPLF